MKKSILLASIIATAMFAGSSVAKADDADVRSHSLGVRLGYFQPLHDYLGWDGGALEVEYRGIFNRWFGASVMTSFAGAFSDETIESDDDDSAVRFGVWNDDVDKTYTEFQLVGMLQFYPVNTDTLKFYFTAGGFYSYAQLDIETDHGRSHTDTTYDGDGFGFICGIGFEVSSDIFRLRLEADALSELSYDDGETRKIPDEELQAMVRGELGFFVSDKLSIDVAARYFTEWKDLYVTIGGTFTF